MIKTIFSKERLSRVDYALGLALIAACFTLFFHLDMWGVGWDSLSYLFGSPLEFYDNAKKFHGSMVGTPYPPTIYIIFAVWLYPLKLLGLITGPDAFSTQLIYWQKTLTTLFYAASGIVFYRIALQYIADRQWAKYATAIWLTTPFILYTHFIYSQYDIFYVVLVLAGFLLFLRNSPYRASICFGLAVTFKYFPAFSYLPLLLLYEKRIPKIAICVLIFITPLLLVEFPYGDSPAFIQYVKNHFALDRVFAAAMEVGAHLEGIQIHFLFASFAVLCGLAYFTDPSAENRIRTAAYVWLVASILPFLFIYWHPQWISSVAPAIVLTSMISAKQKRFLLLDFVGMGFFIATITVSWPHVLDANLLNASWLGIDFGNSFPMFKLFDWFGSHTLNMFLSGFWGYLALQIILKNGLLRDEPLALGLQHIDYGEVRRRLYLGLLIFLLPAAFSIYVDLKRHEAFTLNLVGGRDFGELTSGRSFEQTFVADGKTITRISLLFTTFGRYSTVDWLGRSSAADVVLEIVDPTGRVVAKDVKSAAAFWNLSWQDFSVHAVPVLPKALYKIRLTAPLAKAGNAVGWSASDGDSYPRGTAMVDGKPENGDFAFRVGFAK